MALSFSAASSNAGQQGRRARAARTRRCRAADRDEPLERAGAGDGRAARAASCPRPASIRYLNASPSDAAKAAKRLRNGEFDHRRLRAPRRRRDRHRRRPRPTPRSTDTTTVATDPATTDRPATTATDPATTATRRPTPTAHRPTPSRRDTAPRPRPRPTAAPSALREPDRSPARAAVRGLRRPSAWSSVRAAWVQGVNGGALSAEAHEPADRDRRGPGIARDDPRPQRQASWRSPRTRRPCSRRRTRSRIPAATAHKLAKILGTLPGRRPQGDRRPQLRLRLHRPQGRPRPGDADQQARPARHRRCCPTAGASTRRASSRAR